MFHDPGLHLGPSLLAGQLALDHLRVHGLTLRAQLLDEGLLLGRGVREQPRPAKPRAVRPIPPLRPSTGACERASPSEPSGRIHPALAAEVLPPLPLFEPTCLEPTCLEPTRFEAREAIHARECPRLYGILSECWTSTYNQCESETKELDGAHLRLPMCFGGSIAPSGRWTSQPAVC